MKRMTASMAVAAMIATMGLPTGIGADTAKLLDESQKDDEKRFLATLSGEPKRIWSRRIRAGLTESELDFIRKKLNENAAMGAKVPE